MWLSEGKPSRRFRLNAWYQWLACGRSYRNSRRVGGESESCLACAGNRKGAAPRSVCAINLYTYYNRFTGENGTWFATLFHPLNELVRKKGDVWGT
jgi:hypothetical protein